MATRVRARARPGGRSGAPARRRFGPLPIDGEVTPQFLTLAATTAVLILLGLLMTFSASFVTATAESGNPFGIFSLQLMWCLLGAGPMVVATLVDYRTWRPFAAPLLIMSLVAAALVLVPGVGKEINGAWRWLDFGPVDFQPTELLKLSLPLYLAHLLGRRWARLRQGDLHGLLLPAVPLLALVGGLVLAEPDLETAMLIVGIGGLVLFAAGLPGRIIAGGVLALVLAGVQAISNEGFRRGRLLAWIDPMAYADTYGYQTVQGLIALGSGGWLGVGLGQSRGKWLYIPNAHTDFIFAIVGEELGLIGALFVLALFVALAVGGLRTAGAAPDPFGRLLATALTGWLLVQAGMNMSSVVGLLPVTGVTLPLVSYGGSSLVFTMLGLGLLMSIARAGQGSAPPGEGGAPAPPGGGERIEGGAPAPPGGGERIEGGAPAPPGGGEKTGGGAP